MRGAPKERAPRNAQLRVGLSTMIKHLFVKHSKGVVILRLTIACLTFPWVLIPFNRTREFLLMALVLNFWTCVMSLIFKICVSTLRKEYDHIAIRHLTGYFLAHVILSASWIYWSFGVQQSDGLFIAGFYIYNLIVLPILMGIGYLIGLFGSAVLWRAQQGAAADRSLRARPLS